MIARQHRTSAKGIFTRSLKAFRRAIETKKDVLLIGNKYKDLERSWQVLQEKHEAYAAVVDGTSENIIKEINECIEDLEDQYDGAEAKWYEFSREKKEEALRMQEREIRLRQDEERCDQILHIRRLRDLEEATFNIQAENIDKMLIQERGKEVSSMGAISEAISKLELQLDRCKSTNKDYILVLDDTKVTQEITWIKELQSKYDTLNYEGNTIGNKQSVISGIYENSNRDGGMKLERMKMPHFNGAIREYARFKSDFLKQVMPEMNSKEKAAYALRSCLSSVPYAKVKNVDDHYDMIWERLDDVYGRATKMVDVVMHDIRKIKSIKDGEDKSFIELVEVVENGFLDLKRLKMDHEICNSSSVAMIEEKLPPSIKRQWTLHVINSTRLGDNSSRFKSLLEFLLDYKRAIEYETMNIRVSGKTSEDHQCQDQIIGHISIEDRSTDSEVDKKSEGSYDRHEHFRCWLHKSNSHPIWACKTFKAASPDERVTLVRDNRACWSCLRQGHKVSICKYRYKCDKENCTKYHHQSLHDGDTAAPIIRS